MSKQSGSASDKNIKSAWGSFGKGDYDKAFDLFNEATESVKDRSALFGRACSLYRMADYEGAIDDLNKLAKSEPSNPEIFHTRAHVYGSNEQYDKALADLEKVLSLDPENAEAWCDMGGLYLVTEEYSEASRCFGKTADLDKSCACAWLGKGVTALLMKEVKKAGEYLNIALKLDKKNTLAYMARAELSFSNGNSNEAIKDVKKLFSLDNDFKQRFSEQYASNEGDDEDRFDEKDIV